MINRKGQSAIEYVALFTIVIGVFIGMSLYFKRGVQGRWKTAIDDLGDQYDPRLTNSSVRHGISTNSLTRITTVDARDGKHTFRDDTSNTIERKVGSSSVTGVF